MPDHFAPNKDICSANLCKVMREFAYENNIENYFEVGQMGIEHALLPEKGLVVPGDLVLVRILIPAHMEHLAHFQRGSAVLISSCHHYRAGMVESP